MARKPYKKDLTPIGRGGISTHTGKGASEQRRGSGGDESLTGGDPYERATNRYPKPAPQPESEPEMEPPAPPVPMGPQPSRAPTAMMPGGGGDNDEAA